MILKAIREGLLSDVVYMHKDGLISNPNVELISNKQNNTILSSIFSNMLDKETKIDILNRTFNPFYMVINDVKANKNLIFFNCTDLKGRTNKNILLIKGIVNG